MTFTTAADPETRVVSSDSTSAGVGASMEPRTLDELRQLIHRRLCEKENLLDDQFPLAQTQIMRGGECCGMQFVVQGPRAVRLTAVWAADRNEVFLYDAAGQRYEKVELKRRIAA